MRIYLLFSVLFLSLSSFAETSGVKTVTGQAKIPTYIQVHCVNTKSDRLHRDVYFFNKNAQRYAAELTKLDDTGKPATESLGEVELNLFQDDLVSMAGPSVVAEFNLPTGVGAVPARVQFNKPYYESNSWLCKAK